jgi:hypothetical protein
MKEQKIKDLITPTPPTAKQLFDSGIPVNMAEFITNVNNADLVPETHFSEASKNSSRRVEMRWTPQALYCLQKNKYFVVPAAQVKFAHFR